MPKTLPRFEDFEGEKELIEDLVFYGVFSVGSCCFFSLQKFSDLFIFCNLIQTFY